MRTIERNYTKNPHTATFLQTFHSGIGTNGRNYREEMNVTETQALELEANQDADLLDEVDDKEAVDLRSAGQVTFMDDLIARLTRLDPAAGEAARAFTELTTGKGGWTPGRDGNASEWISRMLAKENELKTQGRKAPAAPQPTTEVPDGRYAVEEDGELKFFHVRNGKAGTRWEGFTFLDIQASDDTFAIRDRARKARVLAAILADVKGALARYGIELGVCGRCGRTLTSEYRKLGIGPVCIDK